VAAIETLDNAENADRAIVTDLLGYGIAAGLTLTEQSSPNLTLQKDYYVLWERISKQSERDYERDISFESPLLR
jgi:hypothetical protein